MIKINVKIETLKKDLEAVGREKTEKIPEFSLRQIDLLVEKKEEKIEEKKSLGKKYNFLPFLVLILILFFGLISFLFLKEKPENIENKTTLSNQAPIEEKTKEEKIEETKEETNLQTKENLEKIDYLIKSEKEFSINLSELNSQYIKEALIEEKLKKEEPFNFKKINFIFGGEKISASFFFQKIFDPKVENEIALKGFLDNFTEKYDILIYYTPTKEYLVLVFEIKNQNVVKTFIEYWLKGNENNPNLNFIFLGENPGKNLAKIQTKKLENYEIILIPFEKQNYGVNFLLAKNYFIIYGNDAVLNFIMELIKNLP